MKVWKEKLIFSGVGCQWDGGGHRGRGNEDVYRRCVLYAYKKREE
jgi:hypothetical protein